MASTPPALSQNLTQPPNSLPRCSLHHQTKAALERRTRVQSPSQKGLSQEGQQTLQGRDKIVTAATTMHCKKQIKTTAKNKKKNGAEEPLNICWVQTNKHINNNDCQLTTGKNFLQATGTGYKLAIIRFNGFGLQSHCFRSFILFCCISQ